MRERKQETREILKHTIPITVILSSCVSVNEQLLLLGADETSSWDTMVFLYMVHHLFVALF
jgi:hypothetical protein